jgi:hypothetical protein
VGRRLLVVVLLALSVCGAARAATATDPMEAQEWWLARIGADPSAAPPPGVPITILDSGVDPTHPEFAGRPNTTFVNDQTVVGNSEYHGTFVASVAAAPENGVGIVGVYPTATLQAFDASPLPDDISTLEAIAGVDQAALHCPGVISISFNRVSPDLDLYEEILKATHNGCLVVVAAGNDGQLGSPPVYPADFPHVFTVAATDMNDEVAPFSTVSPYNDIAAPGVGIIGAVPLSHNPAGYEQSNGTSFATPMVSAVAAWVWTLRPTLSVSQLADVLRKGARDIGPPGYDTASGWGIVNIAGALTATPGPSDPDEPNDDVPQVKPGGLFRAGEPPLTTIGRPSASVAATIDAQEDPRDVYRIWVPAKKTVRVSVASGGRAAARIWGPLTSSTEEGVKARRRDLKGQSITAGPKGFAAYVEVLPTGRTAGASYMLKVTAARR